jgi:CRISPR-associated protein (TIGR03986 family)
MFEDADGYLYDKWRSSRTAAFRADTAFVNPYGFVGLGTGPVREAPEGHLSLRGDASPDTRRVSGRVTVEYEALTALALSGSGDGTEANPFQPVVAGSEWLVPGSTLAGAVRSFHEALTDSCMRVLDAEFVPVHRDVARAQAVGQWRMAVVELLADAPEGNELVVRLCEPVIIDERTTSAVWVEARDVVGDDLTSEDKFHLDLTHCQHKFMASRGRVERIDGAVPIRCSQDGCGEAHWRTIVTAALPGRKRNPRREKEHPYHLPFALESTVTTPVADDALDSYAKAAEAAHDVVETRGGRTLVRTVDGIGTRQQVTEHPYPGQVVWVQVKPGSGEVTRVTPSVLWRSPGAGPVRDRVGEYQPCSNPDDLCPSCRLFGMIEERRTGQTSDEDEARLAAYRGHVRFGHAAFDAVDQAPTRLAEMGSPRPGSGQFYLVNNGHDGTQAGEGDRPLREWGSAADSPRPRPIRGRKFYWTVSDDHPGRHRAKGPENRLQSYHRLSPPGTVLTFQVWFDGVTHAQLGGLLVSLDPNLLRHPRLSSFRAALSSSNVGRALLDHPEGFGTHLGKGKGLGLGSVRPRMHSSSASDADAVDSGPAVVAWGPERYLDPSEDEQLVDAVDCVKDFLEAVDPVRLTELLALSAIGWVPSSRLTYPPDPFDFFKRTAGAHGLEHGHAPRLVSLPRADAQDVTSKRVP